MSSDPGSLANLRDLTLPPEISFWPPAPGIWILGAACTALIAVAIWHAMQRYRARAYRRAAIAELNALAGAIERGDPVGVARISSVLKRVAIVDYGREQVAPLSGEAWADFVASKASVDFDARPIRRILSGVYVAEPAPGPSELRELISQASIWIRSDRKSPGAEA
ncbi:MULTISPECIES: DUF4381 domain-containing protein [unclassified Bosea (in: a-proteobacteria)]|uniref:DUF4381 domain-containing protein n=1 Tax=unclassified Bosea (in: a-proteobacteria) TaxID=2653178 RepID=UPI000F74E8A9|nr:MULTISPECIES: DUF4381 domain-containing protein [unclassified Bosea (in: a-proteobacteria)]AZO76446.1 hypothetical protein BLM15_01630 [Bosea sp. Tri-49]RXT26373.1 hypothetical protein B5U98_07545 [Bosea sp. Tri-39]RXT31613.1 hypothetical protein B5U99_23090 [Bosea sp. Tri-54]